MHVSNIDNWMEEIPGYRGAVYSPRCQYLAVYGRGYISEDLRIEISIKDLQNLVTTLHKNPVIHKMVLNSCKLHATKDKLQELLSFPSLVEIELNDVDFSTDALEEFCTALRQSQTIKILKFREIQLNSNQAKILGAGLKDCANLEMVEFCRCNLNQESITLLIQLGFIQKGNPSLKFEIIDNKSGLHIRNLALLTLINSNCPSEHHIPPLIFNCLYSRPVTSMLNKVQNEFCESMSLQQKQQVFSSSEEILDKVKRAYTPYCRTSTCLVI